MAYKIAILDEEQRERDKFLNFFEDDFEVYEIPELASADDLIDIIKGERIDAIAIDYKLKEHGNHFEFNGDHYLNMINEILFKFPAFIMTNDPINAKKESPTIIPFYILNKDKIHSNKPKERESFINDINNYISAYKNEIENKIQELESLSKLKVERGILPPAEENKFVELNNFLDKTIDSRSALPRSFYSQDTNNILDNLLQSSNKILEKLNKK